MSGSLTDVAGLTVGHWTDSEAATGCTVVLCDGEGAVAGVEVRGSAPGTRETDLLDPVNAVQRVHAVLIGGGSAFGLDAASGVMRWLEAHGRGVEVGPLRVPIVPAAVLFDLPVGRPDVRPDAAAGEAACEAASAAPVPQGCVGAGTGATVGKMFGFERATKSGLGSASLELADGVTVGALVAVNAAGDVVDPASGSVIAGPEAPRRRLRPHQRVAARAPGRRSASAAAPRWPWWPPTPSSPRSRRPRSRAWPTTGSRAPSTPCTRCSTATPCSRSRPGPPGRPPTSPPSARLRRRCSLRPSSPPCARPRRWRACPAIRDLPPAAHGEEPA